MTSENKSLVPIELDQKKTVKKSNVLNEIRNANASLVEYRLFCVYLAHLAMPRDGESVKELSNVVTFTLADYARIAGLKHTKKPDLESQAENLVSLTAKIDTPDGGFRVLNLFSEFALYQQDGQWMVSLECNSKIAPMIREQRGKFLRYKLYNTIFLRSYNQQRLYELLKQYERIGERTISLKDLREFLSIADNEYPVWGDFSQKVLKVAQRALKESTDICFAFEPIRASKRGKPVVSVRFIISKNKDFVDRLQLEEHLPDAGEAGDYDGDELYKRAPDPDEGDLPDQTSMFDVPEIDDPLNLFADALPRSLTRAQVEELVHTARKLTPSSLLFDHHERDIWLADYFEDITAKMRAVQNLKSEIGWLRWKVDFDRKNLAEANDELQVSAQRYSGYNQDGRRELDEYELAAIDSMFVEDEKGPY